MTLTGFDPGEIDQIFADHDDPRSDPADDLPLLGDRMISRTGDLWCLGPHRLLCGDARSGADVKRLMNGKRARTVFVDPPFNVRVIGHVQGRGRIKHREFAFASGEMSREEYRSFLQLCLGHVAHVSRDGAIAFVCTEWRHMAELQAAGETAFAELKNVVVWNKTSPGQGSFYRSQHELIFVFKVGRATHLNAVGLGAHGRSRSNVWTYAGVNSFRAGRQDELAMHPTVKPVALVADALRNCSLKGDVVLDVFLGSGTTLLAAEKVGRMGYGLEYDPGYVDVCIRRWEAYTKSEAVLDGDGRTFAEIRAQRRGEPNASVSQPDATAREGATQASDHHGRQCITPNERTSAPGTRRRVSGGSR